jgi:hypothetical protein
MPSPDVARFPPRGVSSLEARSLSGGQLQLCHCVAAEWATGRLLEVVNETRDATIVVLRDTPENILKRITFYDIDSRPMQQNLTDREKGLYVREIKRDIAYFSSSFRRAHVSVDITGCGPDEASRKIRDALTPAPLKVHQRLNPPVTGGDRGPEQGRQAHRADAGEVR